MCATFDDVVMDRVSTESGCGSAGSLSAGLLLRRDVFCVEEVVGNSGDAGRLRLEDWLGGYVVTWPLVPMWLFSCSCGVDGRGGVGGRVGRAVRVGLVDRGSPWTWGL